MSKLIILSLGLILLACSGEGGGNMFSSSELPENPGSIVITWYDGGGMLPEGEDIYISEDSCVWTQWKDQSERRLKFEMTKAEIRELYQVFLDNDFDQIAILEEQEVYDRGGTSINVTVDRKQFGKSNSGMSFVKEGSWDEYAAVENAIYNTAQERTSHLRTNAVINLTDNLLNSGLIIDLAVNDDYLYNSQDSARQSVFTHPVYMGENQFTLTLSDPDSITYYGYPAILTTEWFVKDITEDSVVTFDWVDGVIVTE
jgi:hypothetical protein